MKHCCEDKAEALRVLRVKQGKMLGIVLAINAGMFLVEAATGLIGRSTALLGDSLDMFGDATVYGVTIYALDRGAAWRSRAAVLKGAVMGVLGVGVFAEAAVKVATHAVPRAPIMGAVGGLALLANVACLALLLRHRDDDINMKSAWICSRNDIVANILVIVASVLVWNFESYWPDVVAGIGIAALFLFSAVGVLREGIKALRLGASPSGDETKLATPPA